MDASFAQYAVTPTSSVADKVSVTDVLVVDDAPLSIETDGLDEAVVSVSVLSPPHPVSKVNERTTVKMIDKRKDFLGVVNVSE